MTSDRGKKNREILDLLSRYEVHATFVHNDLRHAPAHELARAVLNAEGKIDQVAAGRDRLRHRLRPKGGLEKR